MRLIPFIILFGFRHGRENICAADGTENGDALKNSASARYYRRNLTFITKNRRDLDRIQRAAYNVTLR